jgi:AcrR family transcriptional regulator
MIVCGLLTFGKNRHSRHWPSDPHWLLPVCCVSFISMRVYRNCKGDSLSNMARPKSYDRDDALKRACEVFWAQGFSALGVRSIEDQTGLNQFAIQTDFGGKEGLYIEAIRLYAAAAIKHALAPMKTGGIRSISTFFTSLVTDDSPTSSRWGCLIVNAGIENAKIGSGRVDAECRAYWRSLRQHFAAAIRHSVGAGETVPNLDATECAKALVVAVMGIHTMNRVEGSNRAGAPLVRMVQRQLEDWSR